MRGVWRPRRSDERRRRSSRWPVSFAVVDPGTLRLRLLVVEAVDGQATVWGWDEAPGSAGTNAHRLLVLCEEMLTRAKVMAQDRAYRGFLADQMIVGLPASQLLGRAWSVVQRRSQPERPVEERELEALLGRALRLAISRLQSDAPPSDTARADGDSAADPDGSDWLLLDATTVALTVDGRGVTDPVGFRGHEIGATVFAALTRAETVDTWRLIAKELEFSTLTLTAAPMALVAGLAASQGIFLDIGGDTTDVTLWQAGQPVALDSLPIGGAALTRLLIRTWDLSLDEAERLKRIYASGKLTGDDRVRIQEVMFPALRTWLEETEGALARLVQEGSLPQNLYLLGGGSALPEMEEATRSLAWSERLHFARYPQVSRLRPTDITGVANRTSLGQGAAAVSALALAAWAARQDQPLDRPARILSGLCQA
jgi:cell division protein FtsA